MSKPAKTSLEAIQRAMYAILHADSALLALAPVYDAAPANTPLPYVTVGGGIETPRNTMGRTGREVVAQLHVWTRSGDDYAQAGFDQAYAITGRIDYLLDDAVLDLSADGWSCVLCQFEQANPLRDPDGITRHLVLQYRVFTEAV